MVNVHKVLVIGDDTRSFLTTIRSLGRAGIEVHAGPFVQSPALDSRYISKIHWLPYYFGDGAEWLDAFGELLDRERFELVIPCDERALLPLHQFRERFEGRTQLAIPDTHCVEILFDKHKTRELARSLGVSIAGGRLIEASDTAKTLIIEAGLPLAIKSNSSYTIDRLHSRNRVIVAHDEAELTEALREVQGHSHFFEAFFPGTGVGVSVLAHRGRLLQAFQHRRVHEFQGASYYRVSEEPSPSLVDAVTKIMRATSYSGLAMFEFRVNVETGAWILLEVNARPWGSMPLPVALGIDFPFLYYKLLVQGVEVPRLRYKSGVYGRNLLPDASQHFARAKLAGSSVNLIGFLLRTLAGYMRVLVGKEVYDVLVSDDPAPAWKEIQDKIGSLARPFISKLPGYAARGRRLDALALQDAMRPTNQDAQIAFVCQGNICRSPMAAALLEREIAEAIPVRVSSFGNLPRAGAPSPAVAVTAARSWHVELGGHSSRHFTHQAAEKADIVVIFDETNRRWIKERHPSLKAPVIMLGSFLSSVRVDRIIADPDGCDITRFERIYGAIADGVGGLAQQIRESKNA